MVEVFIYTVIIELKFQIEVMLILIYVFFKSGLFEEINYLRNNVKTGKIQTPLGNKEDFTRGIWQAIGK